MSTRETETQAARRGPGDHVHYGYIVLVGACLMMLPQSLPINTASIFFVPVTEEFGIPSSTFGIHTTIISLSIFLTTTLMSRLFEKIDIRLFMCGVVLLEAACFLAYSLAQSVYVFYVASFFIGMSLSVLVYLVVPVLVNNWFSVRTNLFIGIGTAMQGVGGAIFNSLGSWVIAGYGWRSCYVLFAVITLTVGIPVSLFILRKKPSDMGLLPVGYKTAAQDVTAAIIPGLPRAQATRTPAFYIAIATCLLLSTGIIFNYYINSYVQSLGASISLAGFASSMVMVGMCLGKVLVGAVCDRNMSAGVALGCGCGIMACLLLASMQSIAAIAVCGACFLFGICYASSSLLGASLTRHAFGPREFGSIWPIIGMFIALGNAFGSTFWGFVTDGLGYRTGLVLDALVIACALVMGLICVRHGSRLHRDWQAE